MNMEKKLHRSNLFRRAISFALAFVMLLSLIPAAPHAHAAEEGGKTVYLKPNANWLMDGARFAAYYWVGTGNGWVDMTDADADGYYEAEVPAVVDGLIFCRMNPGATANDWNNKWNQTGDLALPTDDANCYTLTEDSGNWNGAGEWSVYSPEEVEKPTEPKETEPEVVEPTYYVAGVSALCGSEWNCADPNNQMTYIAESGLYEMFYENVPAGSYEFKVTNGTWDVSWGNGSDNYVFTLDAVSNVTITFNAESGSIGLFTETVDEEPTDPSEPEETDPSEPEAVYYVAGMEALCGSNWNPTDANNQMTYVAESGLYEITYENVPAGSYEFKVTSGDWNQPSWGAATATGNYEFTLDAVSNVTITFNAETETIGLTTEAVDEEPTDPSEPSEPEPSEPDSLYIVAGVAALCGSEWDAADTANRMTYNAETGLYEKVYADVAAGTYSLKVTNGTWDQNWGDNGGNFTFQVTEACDVTVTFDENTKTVNVSGDHAAKVTTLEINTMNAVGNGSGAWLAGASWNPAANPMTEISDNVYEITFEKVPAGTAYEFKFAANGAWDHSWGSGGAEGEAVYNGQNIKLSIPYDLADVTLKLDMTGYNHSTKLGATYSVTITEVEAEPTEPTVPAVDYYLIGYINGADYGCNDDYANLGEYKFVDGQLTATFEQDSYVFIKTGDNANWYMAEAYAAASPVTLKNTTTGTAEKLFVPGGVELTFTLVVNEDDTLTLSYAETAAEPEIPEGYTKVQLHFYKPETWGSTINAYIWVSGDSALTGYESYKTWPGKAIEANAEHAGWYDLLVATPTPTAFNFIFNDGGNKTSDLYTGDITGDTELWVVGNDVMTTAPGEWSGDYDYTANLYFQKPADWANTINAYIWDANDNALPGYEANKNWPGAAVEADAINVGWYNISVTMDENDGFNFIFNDGNGKQTGDLTTGTLDVKTNIWVVDQKIQTTAPEGWVDPNLTVHVPGTFPGPSWDPGSNTMSYDAELGLYVYTFENVPAANYEYKISINGSWNENYGAAGVRDGGNIAVAVPETMDVTVYYNHETHFSVTSVDYKFLDITLSGTGIAEGVKLTDKGLSGIYSATVALAAGTYEDVQLLCGETVFAFSAFELTEDKDVTFYYDPASNIYYHDGSDAKVGAEAVYYDSQDEAYKAPYGAVATGEDVTFSITTGEDVTQVKLVVKGFGTYEMEQPEISAYELGTKSWTCTVSFDRIGEFDYYFILSNGSDVKVYSDDDGYYGTGKVTDLTSAVPYDLVVYEDGFETPDWMKDAVIYQIFPDRFFDGDVSNNQAQTWARGEVDYEYISDWYTLPENPEQMGLLSKEEYLTSGAHYGDGQWSNEIYGGDLAGITQRIDYLKALGVNVIYLNPVFWSISNHRYDAVDYTEIDPILGTLGDFEELVAVAEANDMHIILDGVFNHVSDDSVYFDRYYKFLPDAAEKYDGKIGAYPYWAYVYDYMAENGAAQADAEAAAKAFFSEEYGITDWSYTEWFEVFSTTMAGSADNIGLRAGKEVYSYEGWWGYDSMPVIYSTNGSEYQTGNWADEIINGPDSVTQYWITKGNNGWRLDVANEVSDETWQRFRDSVKSLDSDAVIIGEIWDDATKYLKGDMYDSVMNYQFRNAVTSFAMGTGAEATTKSMEKIHERYPEEAFYAMMNLVGSHDTTRILSYLDGIGDDRNDKDFDSAFPTYAGTSATAKARQYLVAFLQFTYPGAPTIYYGDEIGMVGSDDPDDRRAFEWGKGNQELVEWYATLAAIRDTYSALRTGSVTPVDLGNNSLLAYTRQDEDNTLLVIANNAASAQTASVDGTYVDLISGKTVTGTVSVPARNGVILVDAAEVETVTLNLAGLAPAYDPAYIVGDRTVHVHEWDDGVVTKEPNCTEEGIKTFTCACGETKEESIPTNGQHVWGEWELEQEATYDTGAEYIRICELCGETESKTGEKRKLEAPVLKSTLNAKTGKPKLTWNEVDGAAKYYVYRSVGDDQNFKFFYSTTGTSFTNTGAEPGVVYYYQVKAVTAGGNASERSNSTHRTCDLPRPNVTASNVASSGKVKLTWEAVAGAAEYKIYRATSRDGIYNYLYTTAKTSFTNTGAEPGVTYYYKVKAVHENTAANSAFSLVDTRTCDLARPVVKASRSAYSGKPVLSWQAVDGAVQYKVYRSTTGADGTFQYLYTTEKTSFTNVGAEAGVTYYYKVRAICANTAGHSAYSVVKSVTSK